VCPETLLTISGPAGAWQRRLKWCHVATIAS
jgi:hypothetical protein